MNTINKPELLDFEMDREFLDLLKEMSGQDPARCMQCGKCTAGCPAAFAYDFSPTQVMRLAQEGRKDLLLACKSVWLCLSCHACAERCPMEIDVTAVMGALRRTALDHGRVSEKSVEKFHESFLDSVRKNGRIHELGAMLGYVRRTGRVFTDVDLAPKILNKISFRPHAVKGRSEVLKIMDRFEAEKSKQSLRRENDYKD